MRIQLLALVPLLALVSLTPTAHADTYKLYTLSPDIYNVVGLSNSGVAVTVHYGFGCGSTLIPTAGNCYDTFENGTLISASTTAPNVDYDNGSVCSPSFGSGFTIYTAKCNGTRVAAVAEYESGTTRRLGIFTGPDPFADNIYTYGGVAGVPSEFALDSMGDILFLNATQDNDYELYDTTSRISPEPSSLLLLGTGLLGVAGAARRRFLNL